jgi:Amt family ammonium transporter
VNTNVAAVVGMLTWLGLDVLYGKPSTLGAMLGASADESTPVELPTLPLRPPPPPGAVTGLATVTPAAGYIRPLSALAFGVVGSITSFYSIKCARRVAFCRLVLRGL